MLIDKNAVIKNKENQFVKQSSGKLVDGKILVEITLLKM